MIKLRNIPLTLRRNGLKGKLETICKNNDIVFMAIFGSFVKGNQKKKSDVDILIKFKKDSKKTLFDLVKIQNKLMKLIKRKVDLVELEGLNKYIKEEILNSMKVIYEER